MAAWVFASPARSQEPVAPIATDRELALVDSRPILESRVKRQVEAVLRGRPVAEAAQKRLEAESLQLLISRRVLLDYFQQQDIAATPREAELELGRLEASLAARDRKLAEHLDQQGATREVWIEEFIWRESWSRYLKRFLTEENLGRYFQDHQRDFDGTRLRVAQILIEVDVENPPALAEAVKKAEQIAQEIASGELDFADAARRHSDAPTAAKGGELGWIQRRQPMPPSFSKAAFELRRAKQVSPPVVSPYGVHLIQLLEEEPGDQQLADVQSELRTAISKYVFDWLLERERPKHKIELVK